MPKESSTFIIIPTILKSKEKVEELMKKLEVYYLANKSDNLYFALLGDASTSKSEEEQFDTEVIEEGQKQTAALNKKYPSDFPKFHFLYRKRKWNQKETAFLGWERKRGLITEFNSFLLNPASDDFRENTLRNKKIPKITYVITLDADTNLVLNSGLELIGTIAHVLNKPILSKDKTKVELGHGIIQPRVGVTLEDAHKSYFSKIFSGSGGTDLYTNALSDVYQDNFEEGIFTGKGIYDLKVFHKVLENQIPENTVLSHDLLEGSYLRAALATDILVLDGYPAKYNSFMTRLSRWTRGDWQIARWLNKSIIDKNGNKTKNPLGTLSKFKILDNLRRSLIPIAALISIIVGISSINVLLAVGLICVFAPTILEILNVIIFKKELATDSIIANRNFISETNKISESVIRGILELAFLPYKAWCLSQHIIKTIYRMKVTKAHLLEWQTAEEAEKQAKTDLASYYKQMSVQVIIGLITFIAVGLWGNSAFIYVLGIILASIWLVAPFYAWQISKPFPKENKLNSLNEEEKEHLKEIAKRTWQYFDLFINEENNFLPPDNFEEARKVQVAPRTSPTNIGLRAS